MKLSNLTFILTADCNYKCSYCIQKKEKKTIAIDTIETAVEFFYPFFNSRENNHIAFYGGEPLLTIQQLKHAVLLLEEKNRQEPKPIEFSVTTNGSLLTGDMLDFFNSHNFRLVLSFDGLAQDVGRKKSTLEQMVGLIKRIQGYPGIHLEINSVFSPRTVHMLSASLRYMIEPGGPGITFNISSMQPWQPENLDILQQELEHLRVFLVRYYKKTGTIPVKNFQGNSAGSGIFTCGAGRGRMAVTPEGDLLGCALFYDYFKTCGDSSQYRDFCFGTLRDFTTNHKTTYPGIAANYAQLRQDYFQVQAAVGKKGEDTHCFLCRDVEGCGVCPANAAYSSGSLGKISCRQCRLTKIQREAKRKFEDAAVANSGGSEPF
ncbi:MAG: radical SAM protein [bacterium]|nr:radical SAM protein [bacterium]